MTVLNTLPTNQPDDTRPFLVLIIISRPDALHERMAIRRTWTNRSKNCQIKFVFAFSGRLPRRDSIDAEKRAYHDIVQFDQVNDKYYSTFSLVMHALNWARKTYPDAAFYGKANDDVWINFPKIIRLLRRQPTYGKNFILGHFIEKGGDKYQELYEDFDEETTDDPPVTFAVGHLWIMPRYTLDKVVDVASYVTPRASLVADIVVTGEFRAFRHIEARNIADYVDLWDISGTESGCAVANFTLVHGVFSQQKDDFERLKCLSTLTCG